MAIDIKNRRGAGITAQNRRYMGVAITIVFVFLTAYGYAVTTRNSTTPAFAGGGLAQAGNSGGGAGGAGGSGCACCGGGSSEPIPGEATVEGDVQKITIDTASGGYSPNEITLKAGVPAEITITQSSGCIAQIVFPDAGITEDLTQGAKTVKLPAMQPGEYQFYCGMQMVFGKLIVK